jgi:hypothetical protein
MPDEKPVSLAPLSLGDALKGLLAIPDPEKTKPTPKPKRKKAAPPPKE